MSSSSMNLKSSNIITKEHSISGSQKNFITLLQSKNKALEDMNLDQEENDSILSSEYSENEWETSFIGSSDTRREIMQLFA